MITAMVSLKVKKGALTRVASELSSIEEVVEVYSTNGTYDLLAHVQVREYENLSDVINDKIATLPGIKDTVTVTAFKQYKFRRLDQGAAPGMAAALGAPDDASVDVAQMQLTRGRKAIAPILAKLSDSFNLDRAELFSVVNAIAAGELSDVQIAGFLVGLTNKGPTTSEVAAIAEAMRRVAVPFSVDVEGELSDTCGTGGGLTTFNVSSANAILSASGGCEGRQTRQPVHLVILGQRRRPRGTGHQHRPHPPAGRSPDRDRGRQFPARAHLPPDHGPGFRTGE